MHKNDMKQVLYIFIVRRVCTKPKTATYVGAPAVHFYNANNVVKINV